ncbi:MAG: restriction endonuclease, partial [Lentisphaeria bacterium]|nr:restriction endonuclease [Lentisphaeria bacterium]
MRRNTSVEGKLIQSSYEYGSIWFERLTQRLLRECGFTQVVVTRKTGDGGIDGTGKLKI